MEGTSQTEAINKRLSELQTLVDQLRAEVSEQVHVRAKESLSSPVRVGAQPSPPTAMPKVSRRIRNLDDKLLDCELRDAREGLYLTPFLCSAQGDKFCGVRKYKAQEEAEGDGPTATSQSASLVCRCCACSFDLC